MNRKILLLILVLFIGCLAGCGNTDDADEQQEIAEKHISYIKRQSDPNYPGITYGEAMDDFFTSPRWSYFQDNVPDGELGMEFKLLHIVEFSGFCSLNGEKTHVSLRFITEDGSDEIDISYLNMNGVSDDREIPSLMAAIFEHAGVTSVKDTGTEESSAQETPSQNVHSSHQETPYTSEVASDYYVKNPNSLTTFASMEEFISFKYSGIIKDFDVSRYTVPTESGNCAAMDVCLMMRDDYDWSTDEYARIADDIRNSMYSIGDFSMMGTIEFNFGNDVCYLYDYDELGVYLQEP